MNIDDAKARIRAALKDAMKARDAERLSLWREVLGALDNAEAPALSTSGLTPSSSSIAGAVEGVGAGDIARLVLSAADVSALIAREAQERRTAATSYAELGRVDEAAVLTRQASALEALFASM